MKRAKAVLVALLALVATFASPSAGAAVSKAQATLPGRVMVVADSGGVNSVQAMPQNLWMLGLDVSGADLAVRGPLASQKWLGIAQGATYLTVGDPGSGKLALNVPVSPSEPVMIQWAGEASSAPVIVSVTASALQGFDWVATWWAGWQQPTHRKTTVAVVTAGPASSVRATASGNDSQGHTFSVSGQLSSTDGVHWSGVLCNGPTGGLGNNWDSNSGVLAPGTVTVTATGPGGSTSETIVPDYALRNTYLSNFSCP